MPLAASAGTSSSRQQAYCCSTMRRTRLTMARKVSVAVKPSIVRSTTSLSICCLMPGDAHLEELIQVRADDAEELHPLQQGVLRVERLLQHAVIELQPAQFPIDEMSRAESHRFCFGFHDRQQGNRRPGFGKSQSVAGRRAPPESQLLNRLAPARDVRVWLRLAEPDGWQGGLEETVLVIPAVRAGCLE